MTTKDTKTEDPKPKTLAEETGMTMEDALRAMREMTAKFDAQNEVNQQLRASLIATQAQVEGLTAKKTSAKFGAVEIVSRQCNSCGLDVKPGESCPDPRHKGGTVNEIGFGMKHNRMQPIIVRQVRTR